MDKRVEQLSDIIVNHSLKIKKGDYVQIIGYYSAKDLIQSLFKRILIKGAHPCVKINLEGLNYTYYKHASKEQLNHFPHLEYNEIKKTDVYIYILSEVNKFELANVDPKKIILRKKILDPISKHRVKFTRWLIVAYPSHADAQHAGMSTSEYEDFVFSATNSNWLKMKKNQEKLVKLLDKTSRVQIIGKETDLTFSIKGRKAISCFGNYNLPDGEVFTSVVENSVDGKICYEFPCIYHGKQVDEVRLFFKNGKVVKALSRTNQKFLNHVLDTDKGARYLGEFGIGQNYGIKKYIKEILFDEKIGGTIHLALGSSYPESRGVNKSAVHWDMIKDLRKNGKIFFDDKLVFKNGKFLK